MKIESIEILSYLEEITDIFDQDKQRVECGPEYGVLANL